MSVLKSQFNYSIDQYSPVFDTLTLTVKKGKDGEDICTFEKIDFPAIQKSNGFVSDWSLDALLKAGVNPDFPIHTGLSTRLEGANIVNGMIDSIDAELSAMEADTEISSNE